MENYSYSSYPDSHDSSPRSREIDCENAPWDEPPSNANYKVKFMCSYNGKIHPRPHDNQLAYVGGETKILAVDRNIRFSTMISKLSNLCDFPDNSVCFKYQLPGEDLDALISVTNDEDLEHMMLEYDRLARGASKPARLRLFLFPTILKNNSNDNSSSAATSFDEEQQKSNQQWFVDALNSVPSIQSNLDSTASSPPATASNPDFLFGFEKGVAPPPQLPHVPVPPPPTVVDASHLNAPVPIGSDSDQISPTALNPVEIQRQIHQLQRMQIANQEQQQQQQQQFLFQRKNEENLARAFAAGDYYMQQQQQQQQPQPQPQPQKLMIPNEKPLQQQLPPQSVAPVSMPANIPPGYWQQQDSRQMMTGGGGYPAPSTGTDQPVYVVQSPAGMYHHPHAMPPPAGNVVRQVTGQVGQGQGQGGGYYGMQRVVPDVYREQPVYNMGPPTQQPAAAVQAQPQVATTGYTQMAYDSMGRQVYYTTATAGPAPGGVGGGAVGGVVASSYQNVTPMGVDGRTQSVPLNHPESGKVLKPSPQASV